MRTDRTFDEAAARSRKNIVRKLLPLAAMLLVLCCLFTGCAGTGLKNASFEKGSGEKIEGWTAYNYERSAGETDSGSIAISEQGYSGKGILITNKIANDNRIHQEIKVAKSAYYKVSVMVKVIDVIDAETGGAAGAGFNISAINASYRSEPLYTTNNDWQEYTAYIKTGASQTTVDLSIGIGGYSSESVGSAYVDEVSVTKVSTLPSGVSAVSVEDVSKSSEKEKEDSGASIWLKILFGVLTVALATFVILVIKKHDEDEFIQKHPLSEKKAKFGKKDLILVLILTVVCAAASFYKLGDAQGPESYWEPQAAQESVTVEFDKVYTVSRTSYLPNIPRSSSATFVIYYEATDGAGDYTEICRFSRGDSDPPEFFEWKLIDKSFTTRRVRVVCTAKGLALNEMAFWAKDEAGKYVQIPLTVTTQVQGTNETEHLPIRLFDEQETAQAYRTYENGTYFDEIYFPRTAYEHINGFSIYEVTHPPLGKTLISLGIRMFGMNPFGWRFMGTLMGVLLVPLMYLLALKLLKRTNYAFIAAFLLAFDFMRTAQTRLATIDTYSVFFIILMYYFMLDYFETRSYDRPFWRGMLPLFLSGLCFGLGAASKWTSIYAGVGLAILFFIQKFSEAYDIRMGRVSGAKADKWFLKNFLPTCLMCVLFFIVIPLGIYVLSYLPYMPSNPDKTLLQVVIDNQKYMYRYHSGLTATHPYQSSWYSWLLDLRPIYYYSSSSAGLAAGLRASAVSFGNPAVWWMGLICLPAAVYFTWKRREKAMVVAFIGYACQLFPWIMVTRCTFIYHYFTSIPFLILMIVYTIKCLYEDKAIGKPTIFIYLGIVLLLYILFYPVLVAMPVKSDYITNLRWFSSWSF